VTEVTDLAGIRVVTYYLEYVKKVEQLVREQFNIDDERAVTKGREAADRFGYRSTHLIVALSDDRNKLQEYSDLADKWVEIQLRDCHATRMGRRRT